MIRSRSFRKVCNFQQNGRASFLDKKAEKSQKLGNKIFK